MAQPESLACYRSLVLADTGLVVKAAPAKLCGYVITNINAAMN